MIIQERKDIFDRIMDLPPLKRCKPIYTKYKEGILYLFFGGITFFLALSVFAGLYYVAGVDVLIANGCSWVAGVTFSFFTTRTWVFQSMKKGLTLLIRQIAEFLSARFATLLLQEILLFIFVAMMGLNSMVIKIITEVINIILNYLVSKFIIFKRK